MLVALQYTGMNIFSRNVRFLKGSESEQKLAAHVGTTQATIHRITNAENYQAKADLLARFAKATRLTQEQLLTWDLEWIAAQNAGLKVVGYEVVGLPAHEPMMLGHERTGRSERDVVRIRLLEGFELSGDGLNSYYLPFEDTFEVSRAWFDFNVAIPPERAAFLMWPNDLLEDEVERGAICFLDTGVNEITSHLEKGIYAFKYGDTYDMKKGQLLLTGGYLFSSIKDKEDRIQISGEREKDALRILGQVVGKWSYKRKV